MDTYAYLNSVLDAKPEIVVLKLSATVYPIATGPVPDGELDLKARVRLEVMPDRAVPDLCEGLNITDELIASFYC
jgi:hypothetical protein